MEREDEKDNRISEKESYYRVNKLKKMGEGFQVNVIVIRLIIWDRQDTHETCSKCKEEH